ncbi:MAG: DUF58 domain-containing protein [Asticcacaulis sp.]
MRAGPGSAMIRPTARFVGLCAALTAVWAGLSLALPLLWWLAFPLAGFLFLLFLVDALSGPAPRLLAPKFLGPRQLHLGADEALDLHLNLSAFGRIRPTHLRLALEADDKLSPSDPLKIALPPRDHVQALDWQLELPVQSVRRGQSTISALWLGWTGPLGFGQRQSRLPVDFSLPVITDIRKLGRELEPLWRDSILGLNRLNLVGEGLEFTALREFQPGMDRRAIDWKQSARHAELLAKEFETERNNRIVLGFDTGHLMSARIAGLSRLDLSLRAGLGLAYLALKTGDRIGVYGFDARPRHWQAPLSGLNAFAQVKQGCARLDYSTEETNFTLGLTQLSANLNRRALVVLFSDFIDSTGSALMLESIGRLNQKHLIIFVVLKDPLFQDLQSAPIEGLDTITRAVVGHGLKHQKDSVLLQLRRMGIEILETTAEALFQDLARRYLQLKRQERI